MAEQSRGVRWQVVLPTLVIAALVWRSIPYQFVAVWAVAVLLSRELRSHALSRLAVEHSSPLPQRLARATGWTALVGVCRGAAALFIGHGDVALDAVLTMILVSWGAGAVHTSATVKAAHRAYVLPVYVPTCIMWLSAQTWLGASVAALVLALLVMQLRQAKRAEQDFVVTTRTSLKNELLEECLASERQELASARDAAVRASLDKSRFLATASHDLQQPLQALALNSGELTRMALPAEAKTLAVEMTQCVEHLRSLLGDLLEVSKIDAGAVVAQPRNVRLNLLVSAVAASFRAAASSKGIGLTVDCPAELNVVSDPDLLRRMLFNLVDNAVKFTSSGSVVIKAEEHHGTVELSISDTGLGIGEQDQALIFEDLVQLNRTGDEQPAGHGLGLGIVRRAARLLGTQVGVESKLGSGSTFRWMMVSSPFEIAEGQGIDLVAALDGRRVILLDDDPMVRGAYANSLSKLGAIPHLASTIEQSLAFAPVADVALVDLRLANGEDGFDAISQLRALRPALPVVMLTGDMGTSVSSRALLHDITLLRKPIDVATLSRALSNAIDGVADVGSTH